MTPPGPFRLVAAFLDARTENIISQWLDAVRRDPKIPSADDLARHELLDHLPTMLTGLADQLRGLDAGEKAIKSSHIHGEYRWNQNYSLTELLKELSVLREVLVVELQSYFNAHAELIGTESDRAAHRCLHRFLDNEIVHSVTGFVSRQQEEIRTANETLQELNERVQIINEQLRALDGKRLQMLRTVSHELGNHLQGLTIITAIVQKQGDWESAADHLTVLADSVRTMSQLTQQLLEYAALLSGKETAQFGPCDLVDFHAEISDYLRTLATEKRLAVHSQISAGLTTVSTDRRKLHRMCLNLGMNAVKYTDSGEVRVAFLRLDDANWAIEVSDTGIGITPEQQQLIFNEFYRVPGVHENRRGAGLGLAITTQLAHLLNARLEVESALGQGSKFRVILPIQ